MMEAEKSNEEITEEVVTKEVTPEEVETKIEDEVAETVEPEVEKEAWLTETDEVEETEPEKVPLWTLMKEKGKVKEGNLENEQLKERIKALESSVKPSEIPLKRPRERDFDTDEEYDEAMDKWDAHKYESLTKNLTQDNTQKNQFEQQQKEIESGTANHYTRADEFVKKNKINQELYLKSDSMVKQVIEDVTPGQGINNFKFFVTKIGEDSEKVMHYIGMNEARLLEFKSKLINDSTGFEASMFLAEQKTKLKLNKTKKTSQARPPAVIVVGDKVSSLKGRVAKKKYDAAKTGQEAYDIRKAAKGAGIDITEWG